MPLTFVLTVHSSIKFEVSIINNDVRKNTW